MFLRQIVCGLIIVGMGTTQMPGQVNKPKPPGKAEILQQILSQTHPLKFPRGDRLPLYAWIAIDLPGDDAAVKELLRNLDTRGIAAMTSWSGNKDPKALAAALRIARMQKELGLKVNVFASLLGMGGVVFNGDPATAHLDDGNKPFFDTSQMGCMKMGCPFAMESRFAPIIDQIEFFCKAYREAGIEVDFIVADWEVDGPLEYNDGWTAARKCKVCRAKIPGIDQFDEFQKAARTLRGDMQNRVYARTLKKYFSKVLVGNYGIYPNDGWRYWYDFYEKVPPDGLPFKTDQQARYRKWFQEWPLTGYTYAMPVVYPRYAMYGWYNFANADFRWFRGMLLNASNGSQSTWKLCNANLAKDKPYIPVISFIKCYTCDKPNANLPSVPNISEQAYKELLWHMLLRKTDGLINWCPDSEAVKEVTLLQEVYAAALEYEEFLDKGQPVGFDTPQEPGPVISGLKLGTKMLLRRTDFTEARPSVEIRIDGKPLQVPPAEGKCQVLDLPQ